MSNENITIPKKEYLRLKRLEKIDHDLIKQFISSFDDIKHGRIRRVI